MVRTNIYNIGAPGFSSGEKLKLIQSMVSANDKEVKKFAWFEMMIKVQKINTSLLYESCDHSFFPTDI
ncbi:MAG: hypothetical protein CM15mV31_0990 [uncultured marine virus]|nr:MAG: hypothetical protein CM15mV31_0990 [uncultured marine virus]